MTFTLLEVSPLLEPSTSHSVVSGLPEGGTLGASRLAAGLADDFERGSDAVARSRVSPSPGPVTVDGEVIPRELACVSQWPRSISDIGRF